MKLEVNDVEACRIGNVSHFPSAWLLSDYRKPVFDKVSCFRRSWLGLQALQEPQSGQTRSGAQQGDVSFDWFKKQTCFWGVLCETGISGIMRVSLPKILGSFYLQLLRATKRKIPPTHTHTSEHLGSPYILKDTGKMLDYVLL